MGCEVCVCTYVFFVIQGQSVTCWWRLKFSAFVSVCMSPHFFEISKKKLALKTLTMHVLCTQMFAHGHELGRMQYPITVCLRLCKLWARTPLDDCTWDVVLTRCQQPTPTYPHRPTYIYTVYLELYFHNRRCNENVKAREKNAKEKTGMEKI